MEMPSLDLFLEEAKNDMSAKNCGMYLFHNGVVRASPKAQVREGAAADRRVAGMRFSYDGKKVEAAVNRAKALPGIFYVRAWLNEGELKTGDNLMLVLIGGDIRPHVVDALQSLVGELKSECVAEEEIYE